MKLSSVFPMNHGDVQHIPYEIKICSPDVPDTPEIPAQEREIQKPQRPQTPQSSPERDPRGPRDPNRLAPFPEEERAEANRARVQRRASHIWNFTASALVNRPHTFIAVNLLTRQKIVNSVIAEVGLLIRDAQYLQYFCSLILSALTFYVHVCWLMTPGGHHSSEHHI